MREERITIAIILMVVCHAGLPDVHSRFISMFHMPLFFFVSGYCFKEKYLVESKRFVINKVRGIYIPFVKWSLLFLLLHNVFFHLNIYNGVCEFHGEVSQLYDLKAYLFNSVKIVVSMTETEQLLGGYWFLKQLFVGSLISLLFFKYVKNVLLGGAVLLLTTIALSFTGYEIPGLHIGSLSSFAAFFIVIGRSYKQSGIELNRLGFTLLFIVLVGIGSVCCGTSMLGYTTAQVLPYSICALMGTMMVLNISGCLAKYNNWLKHFLMFVGDHTLEVLTWHFLTFKIVSLAIIFIYSLPYEQLACFPTVKGYELYSWPFYSVIGVGLPNGIIYFRKNYLAYGKTK